MPKWTEEQTEAINLEGTNIIVSAGAGSGKTAVLSERVLRKIKDGIDVDKLLILTFTNAAALEMKERIRQKIIKNNFKEQLTKLDASYITTFDAYALSIVKKYGHILNITKNISICEQSIMDIKKQEIIDQIFEELYKENNSDFLTFIDDFCSKDDIEIRKSVLLINSKLDMIYDKKNYLDNYFTNYYNEEFIEDKINQYVELLCEKITLINNHLIELEDHVDGDYYQKVEECLAELLISSDYNSIKSNLNSIPNLPRNSDEEAKRIKTMISEYLKELNKLCCYENKDEIKKMIYKTEKYCRVIINIINKFDDLLEKYKFDNDLYEFVDISKIAIKLVEQNKFIKEELKYNEILIDEYQDTNDLQDKFISLIEDNNVYMVGDIKQSIYRFRNANPKLFKDKYDKYSLNDGGRKIDLNKNFRSREEVLNNINLIFDYIMDDVIGGADYQLTHRMIFGNNTYSNEGNIGIDCNLEMIQYEISDEYKKEEIEIFTIANDIKKKIDTKYSVFDKDKLIIRPIDYSDIVILLDRATNFELYKKIFEYMGIPLTLYKDESINDNVDLLLIKNIIGFMLNNDLVTKKYCFMSILRSYLFELDDDEIFSYIVNLDFHYLDNYLIDLEDKNPKEIVEYIIDKFDFYSKIITVGDIEKHMVTLEYLIDLASNLTSLGYDIVKFYDYLDKITMSNIDIRYSLNSNQNNSVKIMTIHKSKGLEYHLCYYGGLISKFNTSDIKERFIFDSDLGIITPIIDQGIRNTIYKDLLKRSYLKEEISEKIRLLYVALTRSKEKMIMVMPSFDDEVIELNYFTKMKYQSFYDILKSIKKYLNQFIIKINLDNLLLTHDYNLIKNNDYKNNIKIVNEQILVNNIEIEKEIINQRRYSKNEIQLYSIEEYKNVEFGNYIHKIFENMDFIKPNYDGLESNEIEFVNNFIDKGLFKDVINIFKEYEFIYSNDDEECHGYIDLLLEYENEFKIIDYKLKNINDESYNKQLAGYREYIQNITSKKVNIYLYSIIDNQLLEI